MKLNKLFIMLLVFCMFFVSCGKNPENQTPDSLTDFVLSEEEFMNPSYENRPLWGHYNLTDEVVDIVKEWGFGGVATEVNWSNYMQDEEELLRFANAVAYAGEQDLLIWIIDEYGWPSGKAGGLVLDENPTLEAKGLVCLTKTTNGETVSFTLPEGHECVQDAYAVRKTDGKIVDLTSMVKSDNSLTYTPTDGSYDVYYIVKKPFYEKTHAVQNWVQKARYPDLMRKESTDLFIKYTHDKYYEYLDEYFGETVQAFFTEEPQLAGYYMGDAPAHTNPVVKDPTNPNFPLLPSINFSEKFLEEFETRRGYSLENKLHFLFGGTSEEALKVRSDYHQTTSDLFRDNYNKVIADWCGEKGVAYSGHFLFEEYTVHHAMWIGNILQQCATQQMPGIDMLYTKPQNVAYTGMTALKYGQSAADFTGKEHQAGEFSASMEGKENVTLAEMKGNAGLHAVYGYDRFVSFYHPNMYSAEEKIMYKEFATYTGRLSSFIQKGQHRANVAIYYPEEAIFANTLPSDQIYGGWLTSMTYGEQAEKINNSIQVATLALSKTQTDYGFLDRTFLADCTIKDGVITTPQGMQFTTFILPYVNTLDKNVMALIEKMKEEGVLVIADNNCTVFNEDKARFNQINTIKYTNENSLTDILYNLEQQTVLFEKNYLNARVMRQEYKNANTFVICNMDTTTYNGNINLKVQGKGVYAYNPETGIVAPVSANLDSKGNVIINTWLGAYETMLYVVYK